MRGFIWRAMIGMSLVLSATFASPARAATYYVDFAKGSDANHGTSRQEPFQHCPGDSTATDTAKSTALAPGDTVIFRGGVLYRSAISANRSGETGRPITYDGNTAGTFGEGRAVIDGSEPLTGWRRCQSAEDCGGNPHWRNIYYTYAPAGSNPFWINLTQGDRLMSVAQDPNLKDTFFEDDLGSFRPISQPNPKSQSGLEIIKGPGMYENSTRPYVVMFDGNTGTSGIIDPCVGASLAFRFEPAATVKSFGIGAVPSHYQMPKDFALSADGKAVLTATLKNEAGLQKFELDRPVTFKELNFKVHSAYEEGSGYGAVTEIQGYDDQGTNVLLSPPIMRYADRGYFTQEDPRYWDGAYFVLWAKPNVIYRRRLLKFAPQDNAIFFEMLTAGQYDTTGKFAMMNALGIIDRPGEYVVDETPQEDGTHKVYLWPLNADKGLQDVTRSKRSFGFALSGVSHVTVQGFRIQKQGGHAQAAAISGGGKQCSNIVIRNNEITMIRSARNTTISLNDVTHSAISDNHIHLNRRAAGIGMSRVADCVVSGNLLDKNGATALILYYSHRVKVLNNTIREHKGVHANGLTAYLDCSDILFEGNRVFDGHACLTTQQGKDIVIRNNIFDGHGATAAIGLWNVGTLENLTIVNNLILRSPKESTWAAAIYGGGENPRGFVIKNNVIDGLSGEISGDISHNIWTRWGPSQRNHKLGVGEVYEPDLTKIFVDPANHDYRLKRGSPAINAGTDVGLEHDIVGTAVPQGRAPDIGAHEHPVAEGES